MSRQPNRFSFYIVGYEVDVRSIAAMCIICAAFYASYKGYKSPKNTGCIFCFAWSICCRCCKKKTVKVVCEDRNADYSIAFQNFAAAELKYDVKWESKPPNDPYILLFNIESRIPEDVRRAVDKLNIKGEMRKNNTLVIGMIHSEGGKRNAVSNYIGNADDPLHHLELITIYYKGNYTTSSSTNKEAGCAIKYFFE